MAGACSTHEGDEKFVDFWLENLKGRDLSEHLGVRWEDNIKIDLEE
jgi:hypothetical protein